MIKSYFTITVRNLIKDGYYSFINIFGLTLGLTCSLIILIYIQDELSFDKFHENVENIYRAGIKGRLAGQDVEGPAVCAPFIQGLMDEFPEVESGVRLFTYLDIVVKFEDNSYNETEVCFADSNFFDFFSFRLLEGDPQTALLEPNCIVLTEETATKYFGEGQAIGKMLVVGDWENPFEVKGVMENVPSNSHIDFDMILSMESWQDSKSTFWVSNNYNAYVELAEGTDPVVFQDKLAHLVEKYVGPQLEQFMGINLQEFEGQGGLYGYYIEPLTKIHLYPRTKSVVANENVSDIKYVYIFSAIAIFILFLACINFMNLSTARSAKRATEVGIRKTFGSAKSQLIAQFLIESILFSLIAMLLALLATHILLPQFNLIGGKQLTTEIYLDGWFIVSVISIIFFVGIMAGSYPAFYLTAFKPVDVMKGTAQKAMKGGTFRNILVVFQFFISIALIICTLLVFKQLNFMYHKDVGLNKEQVLLIPNAGRLASNYRPFMEELSSQASITVASNSSYYPPGYPGNTAFRPEGSDLDHLFSINRADHDYYPCLEIDFIVGRNFSRDFPSDSNAVILNRAAIENLGWDINNPEEIINKKLQFFGGVNSTLINVIGVVENYNFQSLREEVKPMVTVLGEWQYWIGARINGADNMQTLETVESIWKKHAPEEPFEFKFMDQQYDALFRAEQRLSKVFSIFTVLAILIACLGLLGLATFTAQQKTKEIGIRKALGASVKDVILLLSKEFTKLVFISFVLAVPVAYYIVKYWLNDFEYKTSIGFSTFILAGTGALVIAWLTVSYQAISAALRNPTTSLRYE